MRRYGWFSGYAFWLFLDVGLTGGTGRPRTFVGMRVSTLDENNGKLWLTTCRIVEYATREQAQQAVNTLSNQNLMGRLVYVREVSFADFGLKADRRCSRQGGRVGRCRWLMKIGIPGP